MGYFYLKKGIRDNVKKLKFATLVGFRFLRGEPYLRWDPCKLAPERGPG